MKKIIALVLVLALALTLAACGGSGPKETKVSVFWYEESDVYLSSVRTAPVSYTHLTLPTICSV